MTRRTDFLLNLGAVLGFAVAITYSAATQEVWAGCVMSFVFLPMCFGLLHDHAKGRI